MLSKPGRKAGCETPVAMCDCLLGNPGVARLRGNAAGSKAEVTRRAPVNSERQECDPQMKRKWSQRRAIIAFNETSTAHITYWSRYQLRASCSHKAATFIDQPPNERSADRGGLSGGETPPLGFRGGTATFETRNAASLYLTNLEPADRLLAGESLAVVGPGGNAVRSDENSNGIFASHDATYPPIHEFSLEHSVRSTGRNFSMT